MAAGRPKRVIDNRVINDYLSQFDQTNPFPDWLDNIFYGAAHIGDSNPSASMALFAALKQLPELSYDTAERFVNRKRVALGEIPYKRRYCFVFFSRLIYAHNGIIFHYERVYGKQLELCTYL